MANRHLHLIIRAETRNTPSDPNWVHGWLTQMVTDIGMKILQGPITTYLDVPGNRGVTGVVIIETSHIALHVWDESDPGLLQLDVYTCSDLDPNVVLDKIREFDPVKLEYKYLDRETCLTEIPV